ncbi:PRK06851 family protein [Paenibacillus sp. GCM10027626]|uniref:PRK06851 family protein n=1 Tax=Paenibacillus sp. GCM10027626 TaxID=3273411 RepID=UPI00363CBCC8
MDQPTTLNYYAGGNTARGFANLFDSSLQKLEKIYILKGGPGTGKSSLMRSIAEQFSNQNFDTWLIHCSSDNDSLDGVIIPELSVGIVDGTAPHVIEPELPGAVEQYVNLGAAWDSLQLRQQKEQIALLQEQISSAFTQAYENFGKALRIHDEWESIYISKMNFAEANLVTAELAEQIFGEQRLDKKSRVDRRFLGAATPRGAADFVPNITEGLSKRYFLKGRAGTGKSTLLKKLAAIAMERGFDTEIYHCGFDPKSLDMVIIRELGVTVFDSTAPHEYFPDRENDEIIDLYERCVAPGTDEANAEALQQIEARYSAQMKQAIAHLAEAKSYHDQLEVIYKQAMDFSKVNAIRDQIAEEIKALIPN